MKALISIIFVILTHTIALAQPIASFSLPNTTNNSTFNLSSLEGKEAVILIFHSNKCAYSEYYLTRIKRLQAKYKGGSVALVLINSNSSDLVEEESVQAMTKYVGEHKLDLPYLADKKQTVKNLIKATRTPEAFVLAPVQGQFNIVYRGAIDDSPQVEGDISHSYLENAVVNLLQKTKPAVKETRPVGCLIK
jgi:peroxiredoxin